MKKIINFIIENIRKYFRKLAGLPQLGRAPGIVCIITLLISVLVAVTNMDRGVDSAGDLSEFEVGRVAERDVYAEHALSYTDEAATRLRMEAQELLVPAVFRYSAATSRDSINEWIRFCDFSDKLASEMADASASMRLSVQAEYPAWFSAETLEQYFANPDRETFRDHGLEILNSMLVKGIFALDEAAISGYNPDKAELLITQGDFTERERVDYSSIVTLGSAGKIIQLMADNEYFPAGFRALAVPLLMPFLKVNALFSLVDSQQRVEEARANTTEVKRYIEKGKRIIRKGFVISEHEMMDLEALSAYLYKKDPRTVIGMIFLVISLYAFLIMLQGKTVLGREILPRESILLFILFSLYFAGSGLIANLIGNVNMNVASAQDKFPVSLFFPSALFVMIAAVFMGSRLALVISIAFPLSACLAGFFDISSFIFALLSGIMVSKVLRNAEKRMDLINAGIVIAAANCLAIIIILLMRPANISVYPEMLILAAVNGLVSGMLTLGVLPPLEHALNAATTFRLIELSDLNAPILRKLFTTAPGTYSHSIMVATLAEQACQDIGANALLARVGAYYHDVGKMDNPDYFIENQTDHNKHDAIAPRLSATVIRSHLKLGVEKARQLGLPDDVISIIAEHHGNSLIMWFYHKASKQEDQVNSEDFTYPGNPPRSRESAVVMLADVTEAAVRTLVKPTAAKMEKFIQQLIDSKVENGQLAKSELTFRDLETIKNAFVKVLAGYYHSRIEYPKESE